ncbi:hypothetical protein [Paucibacter sp. DJ2R-2]|uniref:hypothetical protein n=1 Tax=Paucibacter sp. DJ2R-2 TaxID=2893558 RepID=UPI0021E4C190|nr:hypothetical protein [Paucibacter sp. DJ2R-2]MCV2420277.1 hypothetical protein [Paucibacter sp. DJ4R-1]MCV2436778.1 hypothetical protein [Paucibacter sp. DJ2R-2]
MRKEVAMPAGQMWLDVVEGEVVSQQKWSETHVRGSGGGGYINQGSGQIASTQIISSTSEQLEFWVKSDDGKETAFRLSDVDMAVRAGQRVRIASGTKAGGKKKSAPLLAQNFASGETHALISDWQRWALSAGLLRRPLWYRLLTNWVTLALAVICALVLLHQHTHPEASRALDHLMAHANGVIPVAELTGTLTEQAASGGSELVRETRQWVDAGADLSKGKVAANGIALFGFVLFLWLVFALALKLVGRMLLSLVWSRGAGRDVRKRVLAAFEAQPEARA